MFAFHIFNSLGKRFEGHGEKNESVDENIPHEAGRMQIQKLCNSHDKIS